MGSHAIEVPTKWDPETGLPVDPLEELKQSVIGGDTVKQARGPRPTPPRSTRKHRLRRAIKAARKLNR